MEKATFAAGCFWGIEAAYRKIDGILNVTVGYEGGDVENPTYQDVCTGHSGHAEVVEIDFDPKLTNYYDLLNLFWEIHDPTTLNRQGPDIGTQYRSAIFFHNQQQREEAEESLREANVSGRYTSEIVTEISPHKVFYKAEEYHQRYFEKMGRH